MSRTAKLTNAVEKFQLHQNRVAFSGGVGNRRPKSRLARVARHVVVYGAFQNVYIVRESHQRIHYRTLCSRQETAMDVQDMRIFSRVAAVQNLSAVGTELGLTPGTISKRLQALEDDLGAKLFDRNTRSIRITEEGQKLLGYVERILIEIEGARAAIGAHVQQPRGNLRIAAPVYLGDAGIAAAICNFMELHKDIGIHIDLTERVVNLQEDGYDVVIRSGMLPSPGVMRKTLAPDPQIIVASPAYLESTGVPTTPEDLIGHSCLILGESTQWDFIRKGEKRSVRVAGRLKSDNSEVLIHAASSGLGILRASRARVENKIKNKFLREILIPYEVSVDSTLCAFYPSSKLMLPKLRVFLDFLGEWCHDARMAAEHQVEMN